MGTPRKPDGRTWLRPILFLLSLSPAVYAQSDTAWLFRYPGTGQGRCQPLAAFGDDTGNVYVVGWSQRESVDPPDVLVLKIDSLGRLVWARTYDNVTAAGAIRDASGNIYISGGAGAGRICLLKYNPDGDLEWARKYGEKGRHFAALGSIAVDDSQNTYACGAAVSSHGSRAGAVVRVVKCRPNGRIADVRAYTLGRDLSLNDGEFHILGNGDAYLVLSVEHPTRWCDWLIVKLSPGGQVLWQRDYKDTDSTWEQPVWSQVDESGNLYVTGIVANRAWQAQSSFCTVKMDSLGDARWTREYNAPENLRDEPRFLLFDRGSIYVAGWSVYKEAGEDKAIALVKYDSSGNNLWVSRYGSADTIADLGYEFISDDWPGFCSITVGDSGCVYATGIGVSDHEFGVLLKYDPRGNLVWVKRHGGPKEWWAGATVVLDRKGALYDVGVNRLAGEHGLSIYVLKYRTR
jgi:hypothetical protein